MQFSSTFNPQASQVTVTFGDGAHSFLLRKGANLIELAERIGALAIGHDFAPISIDVEFCEPTTLARSEPRQVIGH